MRVILFSSQFAPMVESGAKTQTIRKSARCRPGDTLSLRRWLSGPYRSKQELLRNATCHSISAVCIGLNLDQRGISRGGIELTTEERERFAQADGFSSLSQMLEWFGKVHGLPFTGVVITWGQPCQ